jgi:hypothetical protein
MSNTSTMIASFTVVIERCAGIMAARCIGVEWVCRGEERGEDTSICVMRAHVTPHANGIVQVPNIESVGTGLVDLGLDGMVCSGEERRGEVIKKSYTRNKLCTHN